MKGNTGGMQFVLDDAGQVHELEVVAHDPDATVADLVAALARFRPVLRSARAARLECDGTVLDGERRLDRSGIRTGSTVCLVTADAEPFPGHIATTGDDDTWIEMAVVGGLDAGERTPIAAGSWPLGRGRRELAVSHDTVSSHHATVTIAQDRWVSITDERSLNGTWVDGCAVTTVTPLGPSQVVRAGAVQVQFRSIVSDDRSAALSQMPGRGGPTVPFNRPPKSSPPEPHDPIETPAPVAEAHRSQAIGILSILAPLVFGGTMVAVTGNASFVLFGLLSPVMAVGTAVDARRRGKKGRRADEARFRRELDQLTATLTALCESERVRRVNGVPDPAELLRRIEAPSTRLWERRPVHHDWLQLRAGLGPEPWSPPVLGEPRVQPHEVRRVVARASTLVEAPVGVDLSGSGVVGVIGPRPAALAVARSLLMQACALHGPADLPVVILTSPGRAEEWDWAKWLPHAHDPGGSGRRMIVADPDVAEAVCRSILDHPDVRPVVVGDGAAQSVTGATLLVVVDDEQLTEGRRSSVRSVLRGRAGRVAGIVVAQSEDRLPSDCTSVVELHDGDGRASVHHVSRGVVVPDVLACGVSDSTARRAARGLARFDDPELELAGARLPPVVALLPLLGVDRPTPSVLLDRWRSAGADPDPTAPIGLSDDGVVVIDLVRDGPHGLVAGTTGAGKSELLRSLVAGLAAGCSPDHCTFVLIDFKGGSAFDCCAGLPHTVGMVTDLDAHLAQRALRCLEAELRHREQVLRDAGVADLPAYRQLPGGAQPVLPRLVVVVDEFATLKAELPDFVDALVEVAQRGRSLGVHLVLATQRPSGAVSENIRANTNLRIAMRVQDDSDSMDVIDVPDAARIGRGQPGRALVRFGPNEVVPIQTALSAGVTGARRAPVEIRSFDLLTPLAADGGAAATGTGRPSDLDLLVEACREAHSLSRRPDPRRPWPDPLPAHVDLADVDRGAGQAGRFGEPGAEIRFMLADCPDDQSQVAVGWVPADGNLLLVGLAGTGTTTALASVAVAAARSTSPDDLHMYVLDGGRCELEVLSDLPHVGSVIVPGDRERQARLIDRLNNELLRRRSGGLRPDDPRILVLLDGMGPFRSEWDDPISSVLDGFARSFAEGPEVGIHWAVGADRSAALPAPLRSLVRQQLLFRLVDALEYGAAGFRAQDVPAFVPGRALDVGRHLEVHVARPDQSLATEVAEVAASRGPVRHPAPSIGALPRDVAVAAVLDHVSLDAKPRRLPLGIGELTLSPAGLALHAGEHALIAGPARSGKTNALTVAAMAARSCGWRTAVVAGPRSALAARHDLGPVVGPHDLDDSFSGLLDETGLGHRPVLVVVDDAETVDDEGAVMPNLMVRRDVVVVAAGRADALRGLYTHWTRIVRVSRTGVLLQPDVDMDGDLLSARLPRRPTAAMTVGRGYLCNGPDVELVQIAQVPESRT